MKKFSTFFRANYSLVVGVAERRLDSKQDAEEIATEAFHIAWQRYQAGEPLSVPWL
ncbi:sigma factor [Microbacterium sp. NPDC058342]|uniref:sigma factor n=1 Tax=Microbacterium sp. NPDC058342 TaxID=3346454 RepID=UPI00365A2E13